MTEESIFIEALQKESSAERAAFLEQACAGNAGLRRSVELLLRAHEKAGAFLHGVPQPETTRDATVQECPGMVVGPYKLLELIGEGGMGTVWMAQQTEPVKRLVALKLIKAGMDSKQVLARFEAERQALALMDHPNIARVLDAGTSGAGRPYFVMELVKGVPLTKYCDEHHFTPRQRLELFIPVCQAVQHAHQKGIIHRDLKPSNVLIALYDGRPVPKVIDFGVAKAAGQQLTEHTLVTGFGAVVATLEYMSPEQAELNQLDIDTRSDIYSLGVLLYELLTGSTPLEKKRFKEAAMLEVLRLIREEEPPRPSTRLSTTAETPSIAANRGLEPKKLSGLVRGELDWIVMKALEKDRSRRYETANGLARDIQRYLADDVVEARSPSTAYRLKKLVRRHKGQVIAASLVLFALLVGMAGTVWGLIEARRQERIARAEAIATEQARQAEAEQRERAEEEKKIAQSVRDFLQNKLLAQADTNMLAARELALPLFEETLKLRRTKLGPEHPDTLTTMYGLALAYQSAGKPELAVPLAEETLKLRKAKLGPEHPDTLAALDNLAKAYRAAGKPALAVPLLVERLKLGKAKLGPEHRDTLMSMNYLAAAYRDAGKLDLALPLFEEALRLMRAKLGPDDPETLRSMLNLAWTYQGVAGKPDLALPLFEEAVKLKKAKLGPDNPDTIRSMNYLAWAYYAAGKVDLALPLLEQAVKLWTAALGPRHPATLTYMEDLAQVYLAVAARQAWFSQDQEYAETCRRALTFAAGPNDPLVADRVAKACSLYPSADRSRQAAALALARAAVQYGAKHPLRAYFKMALGMAEYRHGHFAQAGTVLAAAMTEGGQDPYIHGTVAFYRAMSLFRQGKRDEARQLATAAAVTMKPPPRDEKGPLADQANHDTLISWLAYKEAKALTDFGASPAAAPRKNAAPPQAKK